MKKVNGVYLPDSEQQQVAEIEKTGGWQIDRLKKAINYVPASTRRFAIDAGAHAGTWSLEMAKHFKTVLAFEPANDVFDCLVKNTLDVDNIHPVNSGVYWKNTIAPLCEDTKYEGNTGGRYVPVEGEQVESNRHCDLVTIDSLDLEHLDFLKLDIEGAEYFALKGALQTIKKHHPVIMLEVKDRLLKRHGLDTSKIERFFKKVGYTLKTKLGSDWVYVP